MERKGKERSMNKRRKKEKYEERAPRDVEFSATIDEVLSRCMTIFHSYGCLTQMFSKGEMS